MEKEYSQEESDALILQEMWLADENSTTNEEEFETEEEVDETETEEETQDDEETETEVDEVASKPKKWIAKVLHQRNEARKEAEQAKSEVQKLQARLEELEADGNYWNEEYIQTLVDKRMAEAQEKTDFFTENEELKSYRKDILEYARENSLPLERASKFFLAENHPELLLDKETRNKQKSKMYWTPAISSKKRVSGQYEYTDAEFEALAKKGVIKF